MAKEEQLNLFKPFQQANPSLPRRFGGTGLGLDLSKKLASALGGDLFLSYSEVGKGSSFILSLPSSFLTKQSIATHSRKDSCSSGYDEEIQSPEDKIIKPKGTKVTTEHFYFDPGLQ